MALILLCVLCVAFAVLLGVFMYRHGKEKEAQKLAELVKDENSSPDWEGAPPIDVQLLTVNEFSRPGTPITALNGIVVHYTANPGATAMDNRNYFENLKDTMDNKVSSHFVVGLEGEIVQCIPSSEISYASNDRNGDTLSIESCHPDESGKFTEATYESLVQLVGWLCKRFDISVENVIRHYDVTGKECPRYFVQNPGEWDTFKKDVQARIDELKPGE